MENGGPRTQFRIPPSRPSKSVFTTWPYAPKPGWVLRKAQFLIEHSSLPIFEFDKTLFKEPRGLIWPVLLIENLSGRDVSLCGMAFMQLGPCGFRLGRQNIAAMPGRQLKKPGCHAILQSRNNVFWELTNQSLLHLSFQPIFLPRMAVVSIPTNRSSGLALPARSVSRVDSLRPRIEVGSVLCSR